MAFNIAKIKPVQLSAEQSAKVAAQLGGQDLQRTTPKTLDPDFPLWETLVNDKALIYVPNFTRENANGERELLTERAFIHDIRLGNSFMRVRSTQGLNDLPEVLGISGDDPLAQAEQLNWELYNEKADIKAIQLGVADARSDDDSMKAARRALLNAFTVKQAREFITFPIIHIETEKGANGMNDPRKILKGPDGKPVTKVYYYQVSLATFEKQFKVIIDTLDLDQTLGGQFYVFSYDTGKKTEELDNPKRDSGLAFSATLSAMQAIGVEGRAALDALAVDFTLEKARETIISLMLLDDEAHEDMAQQAMKPIQEELDTIRFSQGTVVPQQSQVATQQSPEDVLAQFGTTTPAPTDADTPPAIDF